MSVVAAGRPAVHRVWVMDALALLLSVVVMRCAIGPHAEDRPGRRGPVRLQQSDAGVGSGRPRLLVWHTALPFHLPESRLSCRHKAGPFRKGRGPRPTTARQGDERGCHHALRRGCVGQRCRVGGLQRQGRRRAAVHIPERGGRPLPPAAASLPAIPGSPPPRGCAAAHLPLVRVPPARGPRTRAIASEQARLSAGHGQGLPQPRRTPVLRPLTLRWLPSCKAPPCAARSCVRLATPILAGRARIST